MQDYYGWGLPINISMHGDKIDLLIRIFHVIMGVLFVGWLIYFIYTLIRFRARPGQSATHHHKHYKLPTYLEIIVAIAEAALLVGFSYPIISSFQNKLPSKDKALEIRVVAEQFAWNIHYPGADGVFGRTDPKLMNLTNPLGLDPEDPAGKDDVRTINQLHIPVHTPVIVHLTSKDVIHSFFLPVMRVKQDTVPGQVNAVWFQARQTGNFEIACAQLCGLAHYRMKGAFVVDSQADFAAWLNENMSNE